MFYVCIGVVVGLDFFSSFQSVEDGRKEERRNSSDTLARLCWVNAVPQYPRLPCCLLPLLFFSSFCSFVCGLGEQMARRKRKVSKGGEVYRHLMTRQAHQTGTFLYISA